MEGELKGFAEIYISIFFMFYILLLYHYLLFLSCLNQKEPKNKPNDMQDWLLLSVSVILI